MRNFGRWFLFFFFVPLSAIAVERSEKEWGLLLLAHGAHVHVPGRGHVNIWNRNVEAMATELNNRFPTEVAFGMAKTKTIQAAVDRLEQRGYQRIAVVPVFVSSHSPIIGNFRYIFGLQEQLAATTDLKQLDRINSSAQFHFGQPMDDHQLISHIILERAKSEATNPAKTNIVLIAHGPNDESENRSWLADLSVHADYLKANGFPHVTVMTHRNDAPKQIKTKAREEFRQLVKKKGETGDVVVIPVLLSAGGIEREVEKDLAGLDYRFGEPIMPHANVQLWVEEQFLQLTH